MDPIGGKNVTYFYLDTIRTRLMDEPALLSNKKFMELFAGFLIASMIKNETRIEYMVGFPLKAIKNQSASEIGLKIDEVLDMPELIDDTDIDICIGNENTVYFCQISRIVRDKPGDEFFRVIEKKLRRPPDDHLSLIINIEDKITIDKEQIGKFLSNKKVPYSSIYLIGKSGGISGQFMALQIYPDVKQSHEFNIGIPI